MDGNKRMLTPQLIPCRASRIELGAILATCFDWLVQDKGLLKVPKRVPSLLAPARNPVGSQERRRRTDGGGSCAPRQMEKEFVDMGWNGTMNLVNIFKVID
jgi:hypothetical protein